MNLFKRVISLCALATLVACGGGSGSEAGDQPFDTPSATTTVSKLSLSLSAASINNAGSEKIVVTVVATNADNQIMEGVPVVLSVDNGAEIAVNGTETDAEGALTGEVGAGEDRSNRTIVVTAKANDGALVTTKTFRVIGAELQAVPVPAVLTTGEKGEVQFTLVDSSRTPMTNLPIVVTGPDGTEESGTTGDNGEYTYKFTASSTPDVYTVIAAAGGTTVETSITVQTAGGNNSIPVVDKTKFPVRSDSISANPSVIPVNKDSTANRSQLRVLFLTDSNAPVKNIRVRFDLDGDDNSIGGSFTTGNNLVYSDANGVATSSYIAGSRSSPTDGLTVRACWDYKEFGTTSCPNNVKVSITLVDDPVSISIGTNNLIGSGTDDLTYIKRYVVQVVDSSGLAKPDIQITPSVDLLRYLKGEWVPNSEDWSKVTRASCDNEDINRNNANEIYSNGGVEDANGSFNLTPGRPALEPRKADVAISFEGSNRTNESGIVVIKIEYPQNLGSWIEFNILVSASGVSATEGRANFAGILPIPAEAISDPDIEPPFRLSPYGTETSATKLVKSPEGKSGLLCTNPD